MSRAAGTVFSLGARVFRPACRTEPRSGVGRRRSGRRLRRRRFKAAFGGSGSEDPRTQRAAVAAAFLLLLGLAACSPPPDDGTSTVVETTALWLFDEPAGLYPSHTLDDMSDNDMVLSLGLGAQVAPGRYGNALLLAPLDPPLDVPPAEEKPGEFGLARLPTPEGRTVEPLSWFTAHFAALMTSGENHLRKQVGHKNPTTSGLNLGDFDWTVEFWHSRGDALPDGDAVVFEIGSGPRGENDIVTQLKWSADRSHFILVNQPAGASIDIPTAATEATAATDSAASDAPADPTTTWHHYAFTYDSTADQLRHYVDGALQP
ncbi:MAG: LamG domain-containing protein, partial [Holophagales bacterium]|nr:LamG domain-containing protein [Holophagales bacterium]